MFAHTSLFAAAAVFGVAAAQSSAICTQPTATVNSQADATALAGCSTFSGSIVIGAAAAGTIALNGIQQITGDLTVNNASELTSFTSDQIGTIGGAFNLNGLTLLSTLQFNSLTAVNVINWQALPALSSLTFPSTISRCSNLTITNTFLSTLDGINLNTVRNVAISNNNRLMSFSTQVANITGSADISANGRGLAVSFPNLIWANSLVVRDVASISVPSLAVVNQSLAFFESSMTSILAPNLTSVGSTASNLGSLSIANDNALTNISFPLLKSVGGACVVGNNTELRSFGFPALQYVGGAIQFVGNFTTPSLPAIQNVRGAFIVESLQTIDCNQYTSIAANIQGKVTCVSKGATVGGTSTSTGSSSSPSKTGNAAVASFGLSEAAVGVSVVGGLLQMLL